MVQCGFPDQWWDRAKECCCCLRNEYDKMADGRTTYEQRCCVKFDGPLTPFWSQGQLQAHLLGKECASICQKDASQNLRGIRTTCGERMVRRLAYRGSRRLRELGTLRYPRQTFRSTMKSHKKDIRRFHVQTELSNSSIFLDPNAAKCLPGKPWASLKTNVDSIFRKSKRWRLFGAWMIYIYIYINISPDEVHRTKLYVLDETAFPFQSTTSMWRSKREQASMNASEQTLNDHWSDERKVLLS